MRWQSFVGFLLDVRQLPEDTDDTMPLPQRASDLDSKATAVRIHEDDLRVRHLRRAGDLAGKVLARPAGVLVGYDR
jgi:hypothetical protein